MLDLREKKVVVTGASRMIGAAVCRKLQERGAYVLNPDHHYVDFANPVQTSVYFYYVKPDYVIHCAGYNGNIQFNLKYPADVFFKNAMMGLNVLSAAHENNVEKVVSVMSACAMPDSSPDDLYSFREEDLWNGSPPASVECHGLAKRNLDAYSRFLHKQHGRNYVVANVTNTYGPGDSTDLNRTKVVMSLIKKFADMKKVQNGSIEIWGSGAAKRDFIFCDDAAEGIVRTLERYDEPTLPLNIATGEMTSINELIEYIQYSLDFKGRVVYDKTKPDGHLYRGMNISRMVELLKWVPQVSMVEGIEKTVSWYGEQNKC